MNKIYEGTISSFRLLKKTFLLALFFTGFFISGYAQVSVTATAGITAATPYSTLKAAFDAVNAGTHKGDITVSIINNTTELATAVLNSSSSPSDYTSLLVKPAGTFTISGNIAGAIIKLNGADNVTIDGFVTSGPVRALSIVNTNSSPSSATGIWVASASSSDGANTNIIQNCNVIGSGPTTAYLNIVQSSGTTIGDVAETENSGNTYINNNLNSALYGLALVGSGAVNDTDNNVSANIIGSANAINKMGYRGIFIAQQTDVFISGNTIAGITSTAGNFTFQTSGIYVGGTISGGTIEKNIISDIKIASVWGCNGIQLNSSSTATNMTVSNNFIFDIAAGGYTTSNTVDDNGFGIAVNTGGGYKIYYNSVDLSTSQTSASSLPASMWIGGSATIGTLDIRNNIFSMRQTVPTTRYAIYSNLPKTVFSIINYNDYYSTGSLGFLGSARANLAAWQTATDPQDKNSVSVNPQFISATNLHLAGNSPLNALAIPLAAVTSDIDNDVRNATTPDIGADEFTPPNCTGNTPGTASSSVTELCVTGSATLSATGYAFGTGLIYQWQVSTTFAGTYTDLAGQNNPLNGFTGTITGTRYYRLKVTCSFTGGAPAYSNIVTITVNTPAVTGATGGTRCGVGTVSLSATGTNLKWYNVATGGVPIGTGSPFTTPVINGTTTFWVSETQGGTTLNGGKLSTDGSDGTFTNGGIFFTANENFTLNSVVMYPTGSGTNTIQLLAGSTTTGTPIYTTNHYFAGANPTGEVVPLSWNIPPGTYTIYQSVQGAPCWRDYTGIPYPYNIGTAVTLTQGTLTDFYYFFYNWNITTGCESNRVAVTATVTTPPVINVAATPGFTICSGNSVTLTASSPNSGYVYNWTPGGMTGPGPHTVSPTTTTVYTISGDDGTCRNDITRTVTVNNTPTDMTVSPSNASVCPDAAPPYATTPLVVTGGLVADQTVFFENAESAAITNFAVGGTGVTMAQNTTYFYQGAKSIHLTYLNNADGFTAKTSPNLNLSTYSSPILTFYHIAGLEGTAASPFDVGFVEYSLDGGLTYTTFPTSSYVGTGVLFGGAVGFNQASYTDWNAQFASSASTPGIAPAASLWKKEEINLGPWQTNTQFRIRFRIKADASVIYYGWLIDNIRISGTTAPITWNPTTNLFIDAAGTIGYTTGTFASTVYYNATANSPATVYTATSTGGASCTKTATTTIAATSAGLAATISASPSGTICSGTPVTFTAAVTNGGSAPGFEWYVDPVGAAPATKVSPGPVGTFTPGLNPYTILNLANGDAVYARVLSNSSCPGTNPRTTNTITLTVNPTPNVTISGGNTVCTGTNTVLTANGTIALPGTITGYQWYVDGTIISGATLTTYNATSPGGSYTVVATSNLGCKDTSVPKVLTQPTYTINATAGPNGSISPAGVIIVPCGENQTFTITPNSSYTIQTVLIDGVNDPLAVTLGSYTFTNVTGNHTINATFYNPLCPNPPSANAGPNASVCANSSYSLTGTITGGLTTGTWSTSGTGTFSPNNIYGTAATYTPSALDASLGTVILTLTSGIPTPPCTFSFSTLTLTIKPSPKVTVNGLTGICTAGRDSSILSADTSTTVQNITGFQWYNGATPIGSATNDTLIVTATGTYSIRVNSANGCTAADTITVTLFPAPTLTISGNLTICTGSETELTAVGVPVSGTISPTGYQWYIGATPIVGATSATYLASVAGTYKATVTNSNGCRSVFSNTLTLTNDNSPLNGDYTIGAGPASCTNYVSFASAINDLNNRSINGDVRFSVQPGHVETAPVGGLALGSAALNTASNTFDISFSKDGAGANPLINAYTGGTGTPASVTPDGIWSLRGINNVSIIEISLAENAANTTVATTMEYGFGLFKRDLTDGAQNNTIENCTITLNKINSATAAGPMPEGSNGIVIVNATAGAATTALVPTTAGGTNSNNKFYGNSITNCHIGIGFSGYLTPSATLADVNNDVGGSSATTGNNISNFGNSGDATVPSGIRIVNQRDINVSYNTFRNNNGTGVNTTNSLIGIRAESGTGASANIRNNTIILTSAATGVQATTGIENGIGSTPASNTVLISGNNITMSATLVTTAPMSGIINTSTAATVNISNNTIESCSLPGTGTFIGISNTAAPANLTINNNSVLNNTKTSTGIMTLIAVGSPLNSVINNNTLSGNILTGGAATCIFNCVLGSTSNYIFNGNTIYNNSINGMSGTGAGAIYGYYNAASPLQETITNNIIRRLYITGPGTSTGLHIIRGIHNNTSNSISNLRTVSGNQIDSLYSKSIFSAAVTGIYSQNGYNTTISKNFIHSLVAGQGTTGGALVKGMSLVGGVTTKVWNNFISLNLAEAFFGANGVLTSDTAVAGIDIGSGSATAVSLFFNTIRLAGSGNATSFGSSGISTLTNSASTVDIRNNIVVNQTTAGTSARAVALRRRSVALTGYSTNSNNNVWYTTQTSITPLYFNGTTSYTTLAAFKAQVAPRETNSLDVLPLFVNAALNNLHLSGANCNLDGTGIPILLYTDDYDGDIRNIALPDIGADEFEGTGGSPVWKGVNTDWEDPSNWCGVVPTITTNVIIPAGAPNYPVITTVTPVANNMTIAAGASVTIDPTGALSTKGSWTNNGILTNNGLIVLNGTTNQVFPGTGTGTLPAMTSLTVNNPGGATINKRMTITGTLKPKAGVLTLVDTLILHSDLSGTASVDTVQGSIAYSGIGAFQVERYISSVTKIGWRFLSAPVNGTQTINQAWQEGQPAGSTVSTGYGTQIVGPSASGPGFDINNTIPSAKKYNPLTNTWVTIPGTANPISTTEGYMLFVRGDRGSSTFGSQSATTLRMAGPIKTGNVTLSTPTANTFISVGNPYPSAVDFAATTRVGLFNGYYLWDPKLGTYGGYQTFTLSGAVYVPSPGGGSYAGGNTFIESGMAFFVRSNAGAAPHSISFSENSKVSGSNQVARPAGLPKNLRTNLSVVSGAEASLYDGVRVDFDAAYSNTTDDNDAVKMNNFGENIGLLRGDKIFAVERRAEIADRDTIFYSLGQLRQQQYELEFTAEGLSSAGLTGYLEDAYLNSSTVISLEGVTKVNFTVNADAGSSGPDRFRLVFRQLGPVPVMFTNVWAVKQGKDILVSWKVDQELNIDHYEVEKSSDGTGYVKIGAKASNGTGSTAQYSLRDLQPKARDNFYRIKSVGTNDSKYSQVVKVNIGAEPGVITIYPNPVKEDGLLNVKLENLPSGVYNINVLNAAGQNIMNKKLIHNGINTVYNLNLKSLSHGNYVIQVGEGNKVKLTVKIVY